VGLDFVTDYIIALPRFGKPPFPPFVYWPASAKMNRHIYLKPVAEIDGQLISQKVLDQVKARIEKLHRKPSLAVLMVGENAASAKYVSKKAKAAEYVGIEFFIHKFPEHVTADQLMEDVIRVQLRTDALIVQLPLPKHINTQEVLDTIDPEKDVDCLSSTSLGRVARNSSHILPPTAGAVMQILSEHGIDMTGKHVVVVGQGELVGKTVAAVMLNQPVTLTVCGLATEKLPDYTKKADILISGTGQPGLITADMVKKGAVVIDAGIKVIGTKVLGDVDYEKVAKKASLITPVPGGVGPITVSKLLENVVIISEQKH
jgi:methylenetetrahydrofolate dehydrogenase (NADP+) / methenyltetrahydrofolate cyclohydrolase